MHTASDKSVGLNLLFESHGVHVIQHMCITWCACDTHVLYMWYPCVVHVTPIWYTCSCKDTCDTDVLCMWHPYGTHVVVKTIKRPDQLVWITLCMLSEVSLKSILLLLLFLHRPVSETTEFTEDYDNQYIIPTHEQMNMNNMHVPEAAG